MTTATAGRAGRLDRELAFTDLYRSCRGEHVAVREATCLRAGRLLHDIRPGDTFAGRHVKAVHDPEGLLVGFGLEHEDCGRIYYCEHERLRDAIEQMDADEDYRRRAREMLAFWQKEDTQTRYWEALPEETRRATTNQIAEKGIRLAGLMLDYDRLIRLGLAGLIAEVEAHRAAAPEDGRDAEFYRGMRMALDVVARVCLDYAEQAEELAAEADDAAVAAGLRRMAADLRHLTAAPPATMRQGIQLFWIYAILAGATNYGRMDVYLGDLCARDLDEGRLCEEDTIELLVALWGLMAEARFFFNSRVIVGGRARRNEASADRFALLAMEASRRSSTTEPQLSLRFYEGMNPALMEKALDVIGNGCIYPILYNDDVNVPAVAHGFGVRQEEAEHYLPYGCGEYVLDHRSVGSPNTGFNLLKCVQVVMHNGVDPDTGEQLGLKTGEWARMATFEQFWDAYCRQVDYHMEHVVRAHAVEYEIERTTASFLLASALYDECLHRGRSLVDGGARYRGAVVESMAMINAADSLSALKELVYDEKRFTPAQVLQMLGADWEGFAREHRLFADAPKYGNDDAQADQMLCRVSEQACRSAMRFGREVGFDYCLLVCINNWAYVRIGQETGATPDGRRAASPTSSGNGPTAGNDRCGVTAFLNSIVKPDPALHAGYVHNMKFSKRLLREHRPKLEALLGAYFDGGGTQAMITVVGRDELQSAMREPDSYRNLIVRVGGFSARFVELDTEIQRDIIRRTFYE